MGLSCKPNIYVFWSSSELRARLARRETGLSPSPPPPPPSKIFLLTFPRRYFFCGSFVLFMSCVCHAFASVHCCRVVTWRERADLLAFVCDFVTFPFGILGQVWYLIVSIPDPCCCVSYFTYRLEPLSTRQQKADRSPLFCSFGGQ